MALWIVHTHTFEAAAQTPYIAISSAKKRSGKTRLLEVLELVVARPWLTGRVTAAVLARKVDAEGPTLLLDESDAAFKGEKEYAEALRGLLNTGHRRGGKSTVCVGQGAELSYKDFSTYCAKAIAGIGKLPDTVADRSLPIRLERRAPDERAERFRRRDVELDVEPLRAALAQFAAVEMIVSLEIARPDLPAELDDRAQDAGEPLLAIADHAGGEWPERARRALVELHGGREIDDESAGVRLLSDRGPCSMAARLSTEVLLDRLRDSTSPLGGLVRQASQCAVAGQDAPAVRCLAALRRHVAGVQTRGVRGRLGPLPPPQVSTRQEPASESQKPGISIRQEELGTDTYESAANPHGERAADALTDTDGGCAR